jgi:peptidoglycan hydrolase-like protein with peptidoglycan-binding domain
MKPLGMLAGVALVSSVLAAPGFAQTVAPLSYVQQLPQSAVQAVQERLRAAGTYTGAVDGVWGPDSVVALQRYQAAHQLQVTGQLNQATTATMGLDPAALLSNQPGAAAAALPPAEPLRPRTVRAVQSRLRALGFYNGAIDGVWGPGTQTSVERFQQGRGLQPNGQLNPATMTALGLGDGMAYR